MGKNFTLQEANKTLPLVKKIVSDIIEYSIKASQIAESTNNFNQDFESLVAQINSFLKELNDIGCYYKGLIDNFGLVDYPSKLNNENIFLCWKSDESEILYYHYELDGFRGRKLITPDIKLKIGN